MLGQSRMPSPWFRKDRGMWYVTHDGKQIPLDVTNPQDRNAAIQAAEAILVRCRSQSASPGRSVASVVRQYLDDARDRVKPLTLKQYGVYLDQFVKRFGEMSIDELDASLIERHAKRPTWSPSTIHNYLSTIEQCLRWAGLKLRFRKPSKESAGSDQLISPETYDRLVAETAGDWQAFIRVLWHTGARPGEIAGLSASMIDFENGVARIKEHKTRHKGKVRIVYLNEEALKVLTRQAEKHPVGPIFRGQRGGPFGRMCIVKKFLRLSKKIGTAVNAYGFRHTFATRALAAGVPDAQVAALLGHANTAMVHKHYSHLGEQSRVLRAAVFKLEQSA